MSGKVFPRDDSGAADEESGSREVQQPTGAWGSFAAKVRAHPWLTALVVLLVCGAIATAIAVPCALLGCPAKSSSNQDPLTPGMPRLLINFNDTTDALSLLPPVLQQYVTNTLLANSGIQIMDFFSSQVTLAEAEMLLQEARSYIQGHPALNFLLRDFSMSVPPPPSDLTAQAALQNILNSLAAMGLNVPSARRKLSQAARINDPFYTNGTQYYVDQVNASGAWGYTNASNIVVAIIDTGLDLSHPDLQGNLWVNPGEIPGDGIDNDGNGYIDDIYGFDFVGRCTDPSGTCGLAMQCGNRSMPWATQGVDPYYYHGSHVAGVMGAVQNNDLGVTGIANGVKIMVLRVSDCVDGSISDYNPGSMQASAVYKAYEYASRMGAHVISFSIAPTLGQGGLGLTSLTTSQGIKPPYPWNNTYAAQNLSYITAIKPLQDKNMLLVAAAGNDGLDVNALNNLGYFVGPCGSKLPNVLCVGGVSGAPNQNAMSSFSNYGAPVVHIGAPAEGIQGCTFTNTSAGLQHFWKPTSGTSEAAPMVAGAAAMVLSRLGAADGNYYKGTQVKDIILTASTRPTGSNLPWAASSVLNVGRAVWWAGVTLQRANVLVAVAPMYSNTRFPASTVNFRGLSETYYSSGNNTQFFGELVGAPVDTSVRPINTNQGITFTSFKYSAGYIVSFGGLLQLNTTGQWSVQIKTTTADSRSTWALINNVIVPINTTTQTGIFQVNATGWFTFEMRLAYPSGRYDLLFQAPTGTTPTVYRALWTYQAPTAAPAMPDWAPNAQLSLHWQAFYNRVNTTTTRLSQATLAAQTTDSAYDYFTVFQDIADASRIGIKNWLFPGDATANAAAGYYLTHLRSLNTINVAFNVTCLGCQLWIDGVMILDTPEPITTNVALTKLSSCLTLTGNTTHQVILRFVTASLTNVRAVPAIMYSECDPWTYTSVGVTSTLQAMQRPIGKAVPLIADGTPVLYNPYVWVPSDTVSSLSTAGYVSGVQCDVYRNGSPTSNATTSFNAQTMLPSYKVRLPLCNGAAATCNGAWDFTLEAILPGLTAGTYPGTTYGVRCWTFVNQGFASVSATPTTASAYLSGRKVYGTGSVRTPTNNYLSGTANTYLSFTGGDVHQLLVVDWVNIAPATRLALFNGTATVTINPANMRLPVAGMAYSSYVSGGMLPNADVFNATQVATSTAGTYARAALAPSGDVAPLVLSNLGPAYAAMGAAAVPCAADDTRGLAGAYTIPIGRSTSPQVFYNAVEGYLWPYVAGDLNIQVTAAAGTSVMVTMGNITLVNARPFSTSAPAANTSFVLSYPTANPNIMSYISVITKASRKDSTATLLVDIVSPSSNGPVTPAAQLIYQTMGRC